MAYYSDSQTEKILTELEKTIYSTYQVAYAEMKDTASSYFDKYKERYEKEYQAFKDGAYTEAQFKAWVQTQVARGEGYEKMADKLAKRMVEADKVASAYINDATPTIYSLNKNYESYRISQAEKVDFHLTDEQTTKELMQGRNHTEFKTTSIDPKRDYEWNSKKIHNALNSAILQGKTIDQLTDSFYAVMKSDRASAIRNARTSFTSAQNAGRMDSYEEATAMGINLEKEWIATKDDRTRDSHGELDGVRIPYDELFDNGLMYPADPDGEPCEVYNCRCTMRAVLPNINDKPRETYKDWLERMKPEEEVKEDIEKPLNINFTPASSIKEAEEYIKKYINEDEFGALGVKYSGVSLEVANSINKAITTVYDNYDLELLGGVFTPTANSKLGKMIEGAHAGYSPIRNSIIVNKTKMKTAEGAMASLSEDNAIIKRYIENPNNFDLDRISKRTAEIIINSVESGRGLVPENIEESIYHELGHAVERKIRVDKVSEELFDDMEKYAIKISGYATDSKGEYIAESFCSYLKGEKVADPKIISYFESIRK